MLKITFPEKDITADTVQALSSSIERTHFQVPCTARFCYVQLKEGSDVEKIMEELNKTQFNGEGFLKCERKPHKTVLAKHEQNNKIDPFTLYVGNLPLVLPSNLLKDAFSECQRVDMGYAQRMKCTRYVFKKKNESTNYQTNFVSGMLLFVFILSIKQLRLLKKLLPCVLIHVH